MEACERAACQRHTTISTPASSNVPATPAMRPMAQVGNMLLGPGEVLLWSHCCQLLGKRMHCLMERQLISSEAALVGECLADTINFTITQRRTRFGQQQFAVALP
jgi:hypothetical protein